MFVSIILGLAVVGALGYVWFLSRREPAPRNGPCELAVPSPAVPVDAPPSVPAYRALAAKTIRSFHTILKYFKCQPPWQNNRQMEDYIHDLKVMLEHNDLTSARVELLGHDQRVLFCYRVEFSPQSKPQLPDHTLGLELPMLPADQIANSRVMVAPVIRMQEYRHLLRAPWIQNVGNLPARPGSRFVSEHTTVISGGHLQGELFVSEDARRMGIVTSVDPNGRFAFAHVPPYPVPVFLHRRQCVRPFPFYPGLRVSLIPVQTPRGLQGRSIRPEA